MAKVVVFANHDVGVRCLQVLLDAEVEIPLVLAHKQDAKENIWFQSVENLCQVYQLPVLTPEDPNTPELIEQIKTINPDIIFSFYYRKIICSEILNLAKIGAFNMHGSYLPHFRGRAPANWAVVCGANFSGASLHVMQARADSGDIVDQFKVPILINDTAQEVMNKITWAAEIVLHRSLPKLLENRFEKYSQNLNEGKYYGGRKPEDGRINWQETALNIHNLVRAVAPPYPGAFCEVNGKSIKIFKTRTCFKKKRQFQSPYLYRDNSRFFIDCQDGKVLEVLSFEVDGIKFSNFGPTQKWEPLNLLAGSN